MQALTSFRRRIESSLDAESRTLLRRREAQRSGMELDEWLALADAKLDIELLRDAHRALSKQPMVKRTLRNGEHILADAQPGVLRTKPQAFRFGDHVEEAWEQGALKRGLVELLDSLDPMREPIAECARLLRQLRSAQPFTGNNEALGLAVCSLLLRRCGLPIVPIARANDQAFSAALVAGEQALEAYLVRALWHEALLMAEWLTVPPPSTAQAWTLRDEHATLAKARAGATRIARPELDACVDRLSDVLARDLASRQWLEDPAARLQETWNSTTRGHAICPHEPILVVGWHVARELGLELRMVIASAGRGITGATTIQLALELSGVPARYAASLLLVPDETAEARVERATAWLTEVMPEVVARAPLRV